MDPVEKKKISCPCLESNPVHPARSPPLHQLSHRGSSYYIYVLDKNINNTKRNKKGLLEASKETGLMQMCTKLHHRHISREATPDPLKNVQILWKDSEKSKSDPRRNREQIKFGICLQ
jgi:hypothetical protein